MEIYYCSINKEDYIIGCKKLALPWGMIYTGSFSKPGEVTFFSYNKGPGKRFITPVTIPVNIRLAIMDAIDEQDNQQAAR